MMKRILEFIKELDPENEISKLNYWHMTDEDYRKVCLVIREWANGELGSIVPSEFKMHVEYLIR